MGEDLAEAISSLCTLTHTGIIELGGPEEITLQEFFKRVLKIKTIATSQKLADVVVPVIAKLLPSVINKDQFLLLKQDNITGNNRVDGLIKNGLKSTWSFWEKELS